MIIVVLNRQRTEKRLGDSLRVDQVGENALAVKVKRKIFNVREVAIIAACVRGEWGNTLGF